MNKSMVIILTVIVTLSINLLCPAQDMGSAFTYQGNLNDAGSPANGAYDFEFKLFDDPNIVIGIQVGSTDTNQDVNVYDGYFTVSLDFGSMAFNGDARWLQINVRPGSSTEAFTSLNPRQELTPTPYALYALNGSGGAGLWSADGNDIYNSNSGNVGIGTSSPAGKLHVETSSTYGPVTFTSDLVSGGPDDLSVNPDSKYTGSIDRVYIVEVTYSASDPDKFKWSDDNGSTWSSDLLEMTTGWFPLSHGVEVKWDNTDGHYDGGGSDDPDQWQWTAYHGYNNSLVVKGGKVGKDVLDRLGKIPITTWNYKASDNNTRHMGPMAQDFYEAFGLGEDNKHLSALDTNGVALAAIQALYQLNQEKDAEIKALKKHYENIEARLAKMESLIGKFNQNK